MKARHDEGMSCSHWQRAANVCTVATDPLRAAEGAEAMELRGFREDLRLFSDFCVQKPEFEY
jgi:hypothetical protein